MTTIWTLPITVDDLRVVLADLWDAAFAGAPTTAHVEPVSSGRLWAAVDLVDGSRAVVSVVVASDAATFDGLARAIFGAEPPADVQLEDMVGEAANILAGNVKGILRLGTRLTGPRTGWGEAPVVPAHTPVIATVAVDARRHWMTLQVIDHTAAA